MRTVLIAVIALAATPALAQKNTEQKANKCTVAKCVAEGIKNGYAPDHAKKWCAAHPGICTNTR
ncbi:hypothetical protein IVA79_07040 [Bradyrhizobium sp. 138]|uniref:hypothetical protein n=1 Tax=Bradyrhizobium sp. 138 TaxID=2782615 RepID=UPI001FFB8F7F|nr:hypothetical protein [Bradyrhizobium sp. 138]MCK1733720.1 hypothetical protein [Bradyrhizobium sp. 138]